TESGPHSKPTLYETIHQACCLSGNEMPLFPDLMQYYCVNVDGGHRNRLTRLIIERIERFSAPGEINRFATIFHDLLATIPFLDRFVTSNWDPFLERSLNVLLPMVENKDLAFWDDSKRQ